MKHNYNLSKILIFYKLPLNFISFIFLTIFFFLILTSKSYSVDCDATYPVSAPKGGQCDLTNSGSTVSAGATIAIAAPQAWQVKVGNNSSSLTNNGTINFDANPQGVFVDVGLTLGELTNTGSMTSTAPEMIDNEGTITFLNNSGTLNSNGAPETISNTGTITRMRNTGTLVNFEFTNIGGTIQTLENNDPNLAIVGDNPINYEIIVDSTSDYGKYDGNASTGSMSFSINDTSTIEVGTYSNVISNVTAGDLEGEDGGTYEGCNWSLTNDGADNWSLVVSECTSSGSSGSSGSGDSSSNPTNDTDVVGSLEAQVSNVKNSFTQSVGMISNRLSYLRANRKDTNLSKQNQKTNFNNALLTSLSETLMTTISNNKSNKIIPDEWSSWTEGSVSISKIGDTTNSSRKEIDTQSIAFGFDKKINQGEIFGYAFQFNQSETDIGSNGSSIDGKNLNVSVYRSKSLKNNNFIEGSIGLGKLKNDIDRKSGSETLTGSRDGKQLFGSVNFGKTIDKGNFDLTPTFRFDLGYTELDEYQEVGTNALFYDDQHIQSGMASLGLSFNNIVKLSNSSLKPFGSIEYGLDMSDSSDTKINYVSDTSTQYTYKHDVNSEHMVTSVVGFNFETKDNLLISSSYTRIQGEKHEHTDALKFGINFKSKRETEYAMQFGGSEDLTAGINIAKNVNGFDLQLTLDQEFNENRNKNAEISMIKKF